MPTGISQNPPQRNTDCQSRHPHPPSSLPKKSPHHTTPTKQSLAHRLPKVGLFSQVAHAIGKLPFGQTPRSGYLPLGNVSIRSNASGSSSPVFQHEQIHGISKHRNTPERSSSELAPSINANSSPTSTVAYGRSKENPDRNPFGNAWGNLLGILSPPVRKLCFLSLLCLTASLTLLSCGETSNNSNGNGGPSNEDNGTPFSLQISDPRDGVSISGTTITFTEDFIIRELEILSPAMGLTTISVAYQQAFTIKIDPKNSTAGFIAPTAKNTDPSAIIASENHGAFDTIAMDYSTQKIKDDLTLACMNRSTVNNSEEDRSDSETICGFYFGNKTDGSRTTDNNSITFDVELGMVGFGAKTLAKLNGVPNVDFSDGLVDTEVQALMTSGDISKGKMNIKLSGTVKTCDNSKATADTGDDCD